MKPQFLPSPPPSPPPSPLPPSPPLLTSPPPPQLKVRRESAYELDEVRVQLLASRGRVSELQDVEAALRSQLTQAREVGVVNGRWVWSVMGVPSHITNGNILKSITM